MKIRNRNKKQRDNGYIRIRVEFAALFSRGRSGCSNRNNKHRLPSFLSKCSIHIYYIFIVICCLLLSEDFVKYA